MADYEKVTPARFRQRLKDSQYKNLTGARRAIGRMSEWTDKEKDSARKYAEKHFGGGGAASAKPAKKKAAKKVAKKKATKKTAAKKAAPKKTTKKRAAKKAAPKKAAKKRATKKAAPKKRQSRKKAAPAPQMNSVQEANMKVGTITQALQSMKTAKELGAGETEVAQGAKAAQRGLTQIVEDLCGTVAQSQLSEAEQAEAEKLAKAAAASAHAGANGAGHPDPSSPGIAPGAVPAVPTMPNPVLEGA